ncbi:Short-chain dehydrogenase/reductase SDR [Pleurostoma richardsiae]|uniref:Short-chain dehydrogenase/reductase SDR n=1 Tax=Pleurostoma richardsiae TaxID=41990 RepID=A0AA38RCD1_9PEZI|nr:Short-chain dehydrogenase/reductase SDR [Pleurostoma richardsiae]
MSNRLVIVVTGAATGFGALTARALSKRGHTVFAGLKSTAPASPGVAEQLAALDAFRAEHKVDLCAVEQDMTSTASVETSVRDILSRTGGRLDAVVHNCGHLVVGPLEAFTPEDLAAQYDINTVSTQRLNRAVLPVMRKQRSGLLVWVGSSSTHGAVPPFLAPYFAAKAGLDALASAYALELSQFGIESTIMVPGAFSKGTEHFRNAGGPSDAEVLAAYRGASSPYNGVEEQSMKGFAALEPPDADVRVVADKIADIVDMPLGTRPRRVHYDPAEDGSDLVSAVRERVTKEILRQAGIGKLLEVQKGA